MKHWAKYTLTLFILIGGFIGMAVFAPWLGMSKNVGAFAGILTGFFSSLMIPGLWKSFQKRTIEDYEMAVKENRYLTFWEYITHPTLLPLVIGVLWAFCFIAFQQHCI